jgi:hypothetical protein
MSLLEELIQQYKNLIEKAAACGAHSHPKATKVCVSGCHQEMEALRVRLIETYVLYQLGLGSPVEMLTSGLISANDIRKAQGLPIIEGGGDGYLVPKS